MRRPGRRASNWHAKRWRAVPTSIWCSGRRRSKLSGCTDDTRDVGTRDGGGGTRARRDRDGGDRTAAVADWRPVVAHTRKVKKTESQQAIALDRTPHPGRPRRRKNGIFLVGFAAETEALEANAREKLARKNCDAIVVNDVSGERAFGAVDNALVLLWGEQGGAISAAARNGSSPRGCGTRSST